MSDYLTYDQNCIFGGLDFSNEAMEFFRTIGHTTASFPMIVATDILYCIYSELDFSGFFEADERAAFSYISELSHLFSIENAVFYSKRNASVKYFAIEIDSPKSERTVIASTIANAFAKNNSDFHVILFRHLDMCMLSFTPPKMAAAIYSDWFCSDNIIDIMLRIDIQNLSLNSSVEFFYDIGYMAARRYYVERISKDYARVEWLEQRNSLETIYDQPILEKDDFVNEIVFAHVKKYGDDYIEEPNRGAYQIETVDSDDYDFDMLELELDEMMASGALDLVDEDYIDEEEKESEDEYRHVSVEEIPEEVINDPILLLRWLEDKERANEEEANNSGLDLLDNADDENW